VRPAPGNGGDVFRYRLHTADGDDLGEATYNQVEMQTAIGFFWALGFVAAAWHQIGFLVHPRNTSDT